MLKKVLTVASIATLLAVTSSAQQPAQKAAEPAPAPRSAAAQLVNVKLDLTITDQREGVATAPKTVSLLVADRGNGRIRTTDRQSDLVLNVDASPEIVREGRIRVHITLEYRPAAGQTEKERIMSISESLTTIAEDGKSMLVSQSADPASNRTVKVELKATISR